MTRTILAAFCVLAMSSVLLAKDELVTSAPAFTGDAAKLIANEWRIVPSKDGTPAWSPGMVWSGQLKQFVCFMGCCAHDFKGERPWDVQSFDLAKARWTNDLPMGATTRGEETGPVRQVGFKTPYFEMADKEGLVRPHPHHSTLYNQYTTAPWDGCIYAYTCGHLIKYEPELRVWQELKPTGVLPAPLAGSRGGTLCWASLCADPVNKELVLFGGCGVLTPDGSAGTWVYSIEKNEWRELFPAVAGSAGKEGNAAKQPPPRALSPMCYDPATKKIVLFGGEGLDRLYADTWVYDCATRTWSDAKPALSPAPRFGHALLALPKAGKLLLIGGKNYNSSTGYGAMLYTPIPLEMWTYDVAKNEWSLISRADKASTAVPPQAPVEPVVAAASPDDVVLMLGGAGKYQPHGTWICKVDVSKPDADGTAKFGVKPGTLEFRTKSFDPEWYSQDVPAADPAAVEAFYKGLKPNAWTPVTAPKWPENRQGGGWSTATLDTVNDQVIQMGGGHSSYFGNDVTHFDLKTARWSIACRPQFALDFNYDLNGPGMWAFNGAPWGNHNYHAYCYDATIKRVVYIKGSMTLFYDPATRTWPFEERFGKLPFFVSKYVNYLCATPGGTICWTQVSYGSNKTGLWRLEGKLPSMAWKEMKLAGDPLPMTVCDGSTICYDGKRDRLIFTTTPDPKSGESAGQVWAADLKTGKVTKLNPTNMAAIKTPRPGRESAYVATQDVVMLGSLLVEVDGKLVMPFYDCEKNCWLGASLPGQETYGARSVKGETVAGMSVDLGLAYDVKRDVVWAILCSLRPGTGLKVIRVDKAGLVELK